MEALTNLDPWPPLAGGALIGSAAAILLLSTGRIAGISGVVGGILQPLPSDFAWRVTFAGGLLSAGVLGALFAPHLLETNFSRPPVLVVIAGLLVGFGVRLGNGCTSGHGVCGLSRGSPRSLASVLTFMATGAIVATLLRLAGVGA